MNKKNRKFRKIKTKIKMKSNLKSKLFILL